MFDSIIKVDGILYRLSVVDMVFCYLPADETAVCRWNGKRYPVVRELPDMRCAVA